jgi:filamentous hemagglutinin family protein
MRVGAVSLLLAAGLTAGAASGQVVTDGSLGPALALPGPHYQVTAELGTRVGANLFHSFQAFSLEARDGVAESATFTGPGDIARVISRVTGGRPSVIDGSLRCEIGQADFYFLNPAGVVFGPHATVDVPGSLHVATADELRLADGSRFRSGDVDDGQLSWAAPESFGYLSPQPANLILRGAQLRFQPGSEVTLSAGSLLLEGALLDSPGGSLALRARDDAANRVELRDSMALATGGGEIHLSGGRLHLDHSLLDVSAVADLDAGRIDLNGGLVSLVAGSWLDARSQGRGQGGEIAVIGRQMQFLDSRLHAAAEADGDAGTIRIEGGWSRIDDGLVDVSSHGQGRAGRVTVSVDQLELRAGAQIGAASLGGGAGGKIRVHASTGLLIQGEDEDGHDAGLYAHTDAGRAGTIELAAPLIHVLDEGRISVQASAFGAAGAVRINADRLLLEQGGRISAQGYDSFGQGEIQIGVTDLLAIVGKGEAPNPSPGSDTVSTGILSHAARLDIRAAEIRISDSGAIRSESWYQPEPGYIRIAADRILMTSGGHISGSALGHSYTEGVGAPVTIQAGQWLDMSGSANR